MKIFILCLLMSQTLFADGKMLGGSSPGGGGAPADGSITSSMLDPGISISTAGNIETTGDGSLISAAGIELNTLGILGTSASSMNLYISDTAGTPGSGTTAATLTSTSATFPGDILLSGTGRIRTYDTYDAQTGTVKFMCRNSASYFGAWSENYGLNVGANIYGGQRDLIIFQVSQGAAAPGTGSDVATIKLAGLQTVGGKIGTVASSLSFYEGDSAGSPGSGTNIATLTATRSSFPAHLDAGELQTGSGNIKTSSSYYQFIPQCSADGTGCNPTFFFTGAGGGVYTTAGRYGTNQSTLSLLVGESLGADANDGTIVAKLTTNGVKINSVVTSLTTCDSTTVGTMSLYSKSAGATVSLCVCQAASTVYSWSGVAGGDCT